MALDAQGGARQRAGEGRTETEAGRGSEVGQAAGAYETARRAPKGIESGPVVPREPIKTRGRTTDRPARHVGAEGEPKSGVIAGWIVKERTDRSEFLTIAASSGAR